MARRTVPHVLLAALLLAAVAAANAQTGSQPLFRIERSKNANVVQYDARAGADGELDREAPIDAYWLRLARDGSRKELSWLQLRAYGFRTHWIEPGRVLDLEMRAPIGRRVRVAPVEGTWRATTRIDGASAYIERIFIESEEGGLLPRVVHIDFQGSDVLTGEPRAERFVPD